jgi:hypothetical protein
MHSQQYKQQKHIPSNASVLVIGYGESGQQIARELSARSTCSVVVSKQEKKLQVNKNLMSTMANSTKSDYVSEKGLLEILSALEMSHDDVALKTSKSTKHTFAPRVESIDGQHVRFIDGSARDFDYIIECTGYSFEFPFLNISAPFHHRRGNDNCDADDLGCDDENGSLLLREKSSKSWNELYKHVFPVEEKELAFTGFITNDFSSGMQSLFFFFFFFFFSFFLLYLLYHLAIVSHS